MNYGIPRTEISESLWKRRGFFLACIAMLWLSLPLRADGTSGSAGVEAAKLTYRRVFKASTPEFIEITVRSDSDDANYEIRQLDDDAGASSFQVSPALRAKLFELAAQLNHFEGQDLDVHRKIANLG